MHITRCNIMQYFLPGSRSPCCWCSGLITTTTAALLAYFLSSSRSSTSVVSRRKVFATFNTHYSFLVPFHADARPSPPLIFFIILITSPSSHRLRTHEPHGNWSQRDAPRNHIVKMRPVTHTNWSLTWLAVWMDVPHAGSYMRVIRMADMSPGWESESYTAPWPLQGVGDVDEEWQVAEDGVDQNCACVAWEWV